VSLTLDEVKRIAFLARIEISDAEAAGTQRRLNDILALVGQMNAIDTSGVEPMSHAQDLVPRLREDRVTETDQHVLFQSVAPHVEDGLYLVPKVLE